MLKYVGDTDYLMVAINKMDRLSNVVVHIITFCLGMFLSEEVITIAKWGWEKVAW